MPITTSSLVLRYGVKYRGAFALGAVLLILTNAAGLLIPWLLKLTVESLQELDGHRIADVSRFAVLMVGAALFQMAMRIASRWVIFGAGRDIEYDIRNELLDHLARLSPSYFTRQSSGDIISRASNDIGNLRLLFGPAFLNIVNTSFTVATTLSMMLIIDTRLTVLALLPIPIVLFAIRKIAAALSRQFFEVQQFLGVLSGNLQEILGGAMVVKSFGRERWAYQHFDEANEENLKRNMGLAKTRGLMLPMMGAVGGIGTFVILFFGGQAVIAGRITLGDFVAFNGYLAMLVWPMLALGWVYTMVQRGVAAAKRIHEVLGAQATITSPPAPLALPAGGGAVDFQNVTCIYPTEDDGKRAAIDNLSAHVAAGQFVGVTGPVGSGKSTLLRLLLRLQEIDAGQVFLDGIDIAELDLTALRAAIGYVPQEPFLFSMSVRDNVGFGLPGMQEEDLQAASLRAGLAKDIAQLPDGYDTIVGERGVTLSGGQRQRVALARALVRKPRLLLLDDALSAVDAQTEEEILGELKTFLKARTSIVATHRLASIKHADHIIVLDQGRLVEQGTHEVLLANRGLYCKLWERQQLAKQLEVLS